jgi:putative ABC transport system permease protein
MRLLARLRSRWRNIVHRADTERNMSDELQFHLARHAERLAAERGLSQDAAVRTARLEFGSVERYKEEARRSLGLSFVDAVYRDLRYACRILAKQKGFTIAAVTILAVTIGANAAVFTVVDRLLLRPLPYPNADRLATIVRHYERGGRSNDSYSIDGATWLSLRESLPDLDMALTGSAGGVNLALGDDIAYVQQQRVSAGFFRVLGILPALGREFTDEEDQPSGPAVAVLSHSLWSRLGADRSVVGRSITLRGEPYIVVGVMPAGFLSSSAADVWTPLRPSTRGEGGGGNYQLLSRLPAGALWTAVDRRVETIGVALVRDRFHPPADVRMSFRLMPWQRAVTTFIREPLFMLWAAVLVVLLIGCVNIAGLLLARSSARAHEIATRIAIGGGRAAIVRQLLVESLVLATVGATVGVALGFALARALPAQLETLLVRPTTPDLRVLLIASATALGTSVVFGLFPALQASRTDLRATLTETAGSIVGPSRRWPSRLLVMSQVALGIVLVAGAGVLIRSFNRLVTLDSGVDATNVITATMSLQDARYRTAAAVNSLFARSVDRIAQVPGVERAAVALSLPYERALNQNWRFDDDDTPHDVVSLIYVTPDYFRALGIPVLRGRGFDNRDTVASTAVAVVNDALVRQYGGDRESLGRVLRLGGPAAPPATIVGVSGSVQQRLMFVGVGPIEPRPTVYLPSTQFGDGGFAVAHTFFQPSWIVRTRGPIAVTASLKQVLHDLDPQLQFNKFRTIDDVRAEATSTPRLLAWLLGALAAIALTLCVVGVYGLVANSVAERRRELGVRMALGATPLDTLKTAAAAGIGLTACGALAGLLLSTTANGMLRQIVYGVAVNDPTTMGVAAGIVVLTSATAAVVPALRILRMNLTAVLNNR